VKLFDALGITSDEGHVRRDACGVEVDGVRHHAGFGKGYVHPLAISSASFPAASHSARARAGTSTATFSPAATRAP
jgi:hypothetical protein